MNKNIKKSIFALLILSCVVVFFSCELDNYDAPNAVLKGKIIDSGTNEAMPTQYQNGTKICLYEYYNGKWSEQPNNFWVKQDGTFENKAVFAGKYKVVAEGAFAPIAPIEVEIKGTKELDIMVTPLLRLTIDTNVQNNTIIVTSKISRTEATSKIKTITFLCGKTPYVDKNTFEKKIDNDLSKIDDNQIVSRTYTEAFSDLISGKTYYLRVGALAANVQNYYNYSDVIKIVIP